MSTRFFQKVFVLAATTLGFSLTSAAAPKSLTPRSLSCKYLPQIQDGFSNQHFLHKKLTPSLKKKVIDQYIKNLDPLKLYFTTSDEKHIRKLMTGITLKVSAGDCDPIHEAHQFLLKKVDERMAFVKKQLGPKYVFTNKVKIQMDPKERKRADSVKELNAFHAKYLHFQVSNYLASDMKLTKAKEKVLKSYDRVKKRMTDLKIVDQLDVYLDSYARAYDPHSTYFSNKDLKAFQISMTLSLEGIGATLMSKDGYTIVESLVAGGAADKNGLLKPKDKILFVGQKKNEDPVDVVDMDLSDVVEKIRGKKGTTVYLTVLRKTKTSTIRKVIPIVRDKVNLESQAASVSYHNKQVGKQTQKIALIQLPSFYSDGRLGGKTATKDLKKLLLEARTKGTDAVVLDLSNNGGGALVDAVNITGLFFKTGAVVKQSFRDENRPAEALTDKDPSVVYNGPLVVLTSRLSASASEIVAGALKDYRRAVIVGNDHTFGKGTIQNVSRLDGNKGALKTTIGMFYTAGGKSTQHIGVESDVVLPSVLASEDIGEKTYDYSIPPSKLNSFVSNGAYVHKGPYKWYVLSPQIIKNLNKNSSKRVKQNKKFAEIREEIKKIGSRKGKLIDLAELMKEKSDAEKKEDKEEDLASNSKKAREKRYFERADVIEAINVAADLIQEIKKEEASNRDLAVSSKTVL